MAAIIATYDLRKPGQSWPEMDEALESLGGHRAMQSTWFFPQTVGQGVVAKAIESVADANDKWFVGMVSTPATCEGLGQDWLSWLGLHLPPDIVA